MVTEVREMGECKYRRTLQVSVRSGGGESDVGWLRFSLVWHGGHWREAAELCVAYDQLGGYERSE